MKHHPLISEIEMLLIIALLIMITLAVIVGRLWVL